jgi:hypothetical protein
MGIDGWLVLDIALGILAADVLTVMLKDTRDWWNSRRAAGESEAADWQFLWDNAPESAREEVRKFIEDDQLRLRAQELNLWPYLWSAAPEEIKERLRARWKVAKISPRVRG